MYTAGLEPDREQAVLLCHHGAGYTGLTFAPLAAELRRQHPDVALISVDARAHGESEGEASDLALATLVEDFVHLVRLLMRRWTVEHTLIGVGHSLGGAVVARIARQELLPLTGLVLIDIVEEAALLALSAMDGVLRARPSHFPHPTDAVAWAVLSRTSRQPSSAAISIPSQLRWQADGEGDSGGSWGWRTDLLAARAHWDGWFRGLSQAFVEARPAKLLVLAEREYLDRTLMIASMQGRFQCAIIRGTGHAIQEDRARELAEILGPFVERVLLTTRLTQARDLVQR